MTGITAWVTRSSRVMTVRGELTGLWVTLFLRKIHRWYRHAGPRSGIQVGDVSVKK